MKSFYGYIMLISGIVQTFYVEGVAVATTRRLKWQNGDIRNHHCKELTLSCGRIDGKSFC